MSTLLTKAALMISKVIMNFFSSAAAAMGMARRYAIRALLIFITLAFITGCGGGSKKESTGADSTPFSASLFGPDISVNTGERKLISAADAQILIEAGDLAAPALLSLSRTQDPATHLAYSHSLWQLAPSDTRGTDELRVRLSPASALPDGKYLKLKIKRPSTTDAGTNIYVFALRHYEVDDDERGENYEYTETLDWEDDASDPNYLLVRLSIDDLTVADDGRGSIVLRTIAQNKSTNAGAAFSSSRSKALSATSPAAPCWKSPETEDDRENFSNPLRLPLRINGPYGEPGHSSDAHSGIDFKVPEGLAIFAARAGYIEYINEVPVKGSSNRWEVIVRHPDDDSQTAYLHITPGSVYDTAKGEASRVFFGTAPFHSFQSNWKELDPCHPRLPVARGQAIALTGMSGTSGPHLHFTARGKGVRHALYNPILRLGYLSVADSVTQSESTTIPSRRDLKIDLRDHSLNSVIEVRRKAPNVFTSIAALSDSFPVYPPKKKDGKPSHYNWPLIEVKVTTESDGLGALITRAIKRFPDKTVDFHGLKTDAGFFSFDVPDSEVTEAVLGGSVVTFEARAVRRAKNDPTPIKLADGTIGNSVKIVSLEEKEDAGSRASVLSVRTNKQLSPPLTYLKGLPYSYQWRDVGGCFSSQSISVSGLLSATISGWDGKKCVSEPSSAFDLLHQYHIFVDGSSTTFRFIGEGGMFNYFSERNSGVSPVLKIGFLTYDYVGRVAEVMRHFNNVSVACVFNDKPGEGEYTLRGRLLTESGNFVLVLPDATRRSLGRAPAWTGSNKAYEARMIGDGFIENGFYGYNEGGLSVSMTHIAGPFGQLQIYWQRDLKTETNCFTLDS